MVTVGGGRKSSDLMFLLLGSRAQLGGKGGATGGKVK